jgi:hypothetical protein
MGLAKVTGYIYALFSKGLRQAFFIKGRFKYLENIVIFWESLIWYKANQGFYFKLNNASLR